MIRRGKDKTGHESGIGKDIRGPGGDGARGRASSIADITALCHISFYVSTFEHAAYLTS